MAILKDVVDIIKDIQQSADNDNLFDIKRFKHTKSLSRKGAEGTLQFPVVITRSLDIQSLNLICAALERQFASFAQIAMTMDVSATTAEGIDGYLRRFHQNNETKLSASDFIQSIVNESGMEILIESTTCTGATLGVSAANKRQLVSVIDSLVGETLNSKYNPHVTYKIESIVKEAANSPSGGNGNRGGGGRPPRGPLGSSNNPMYSRVQHTGIPTPAAPPAARRTHEPNVPKDILKDNDVKKSNELVPTTLHIRVLLSNDKTQETDPYDFIIGVKTIMHPVKSEDMIQNMYNALSENGPFFNFIRWTTGEISFMKDLILQIDNSKRDIAERSAGGSKEILALKRRARLAKIRNNPFLPGGFIPNATIVVSKDEVDIIRTRYGFDLENPVVVDRIMKEYFLLSFAILDTSQELAMILFDGQLSFQTTTFEGLRRENSSANNVNDAIRMANKLRI